MYAFCCLQWVGRRRKDECSGGGKKQGIDGQGGEASESKSFSCLWMSSQNLRKQKTVVLRQQTTRHFLKAGILFLQSSKWRALYLLHRGKYLTVHKAWV